MADEEVYTIKLSGDALKQIADRAEAEGISINEYVKRAVGLRAFFEKELTSPNKDVLLRDKQTHKYQRIDVLDGTHG